jgi:hypothetical protein
VVNLLADGETAWALAAVAIHLIGSLALTAAGMYLFNLLDLPLEPH